MWLFLMFFVQAISLARNFVWTDGTLGSAVLSEKIFPGDCMGNEANFIRDCQEFSENHEK